MTESRKRSNSKEADVREQPSAQEAKVESPSTQESKSITFFSHAIEKKEIAINPEVIKRFLLTRPYLDKELKRHIENKASRGDQKDSTRFQGGENSCRAEAEEDSIKILSAALKSWVKITGTKEDGTGIKDGTRISGELAQKLFEDVFKADIYKLKDGRSMGYSPDQIRKYCELTGIAKNGLSIEDYLDILLALDISLDFDPDQEVFPGSNVDKVYDEVYASPDRAELEKHVTLLFGKITRRKDALLELEKTGSTKPVLWFDIGRPREIGAKDVVGIRRPNLVLSLCPSVYCPDEHFRLLGKSSDDNLQDASSYYYTEAWPIKLEIEFVKLGSLFEYKLETQRRNPKTGETEPHTIVSLYTDMLEKAKSKRPIELHLRLADSIRSRYKQKPTQSTTETKAESKASKAKVRHMFASDAPVPTEKTLAKAKEIRQGQVRMIIAGFLKEYKSLGRMNEYDFILAQLEKLESEQKSYTDIRNIIRMNEHFNILDSQASQRLLTTAQRYQIPGTDRMIRIPVRHGTVVCDLFELVNSRMRRTSNWWWGRDWNNIKPFTCDLTIGSITVEMEFYNCIDEFAITEERLSLYKSIREAEQAAEVESKTMAAMRRS